MKKLSIEEKAKAYDEAVGKLSGMMPNWKRLSYNGKTFIQDLIYIFPELKESEDERIKQRIIHALHGDVLEIGEIKEAEDWLEKQGTPAKLNEEEQNRFAKGVLTSCAMSFIDYLDAHKYESKMCVSNGECEDIENAFQNAMWDRLHRYYCKYIEKQGEQKPADKVEPFDKCEGLTDFERTLADICIGWIGAELGWKQYIKDNADVLLSLAKKGDKVKILAIK